MSSIDVPKIIGLFEERATVGAHPIVASEAAPLLSVPPGRTVFDTLANAQARRAWAEQLAPHPEARRGRAVLGTLDSFIAWVVRFRRTETVVFASDARLLAISDYHGPTDGGSPGHMRHRAVHRWPFSEAWQFWTRLGGGGPVSHARLAEIVEDRISDIVDPHAIAVEGAGDLAERLGLSLGGPSTLLGVARGIELYGSTRIASAMNTTTGETRLVYEEAVKEAGGAAQTIPGAFLVSIPVFEAGPPYVLTVRLKRRLKDGAVSWLVEPQATRDVLAAAREEAVDRVRDMCAVPVLDGSPEKVLVENGVSEDC